MRVKRLIREYLEHAKHANRKPSTLRHYRGRLKQFKKRCGRMRLKDVNPRVIERYLRKANVNPSSGLPWAQDTRRSNIIAVEQLFRYAVRMEFIEAMPFGKLERPPSRKRERIPTEDEQQAVERLASPAFRSLFNSLRWTGARPSELVLAEISDYDATNRLLVRKDHKTAHRTQKDRKVPIPPIVREIIEQCIGTRADGRIYLDDNGNPWTVQKASRTYRMLRDKAGLSKELCLYCQRHKLLTTAVQEFDLERAKLIAGHTSTKTTERYWHPSDSEMFNAIDGITPAVVSVVPDRST